MISILLVYLLLSTQTYVSVTPGTILTPPSGYAVSNLDPNLNSAHNNRIYDPNFIPGFAAGLPNVSVDWSSGVGYAKVGYQVGPWTHLFSQIPHFAMGPQCCNFVEVPHTQQFRQIPWGDYYYVDAGFGGTGLNVENYTSRFGQAVPYVGLTTQRNWTIDFSLNWSTPMLLDRANEWASIGIAVTQVVPGAQTKLVYTLINFWMDQNSSNSLVVSKDGVGRALSGDNVVTYHPIQLEREGNLSLSIALTPYLLDTMRTLNLGTTTNQPPLIAYAYLNVEGYNFRWNSTIWSYYLLTPSSGSSTPVPMNTIYLSALAGATALAAVALVLWWRTRHAGRHGYP